MRFILFREWQTAYDVTPYDSCARGRRVNHEWHVKDTRQCMDSHLQDSIEVDQLTFFDNDIRELISLKSNRFDCD